MTALDLAREYRAATDRIYCKLEVDRIIDGLLDPIGTLTDPRDVLDAVREAHRIVVGEMRVTHD